MAIPFGATWGTLIERCEDLPDEATLITPLASKRFRITDVQDQRIIIEDVDSGDSQPLQREQFEALTEHTREAVDSFELSRLPPKAEPYAAVLALHPRYVLDERESTLTELDEADESVVLDDTPHLSMSAGADDEQVGIRERFHSFWRESSQRSAGCDGSGTTTTTIGSSHRIGIAG